MPENETAVAAVAAVVGVAVFGVAVVTVAAVAAVAVAVAQAAVVAGDGVGGSQRSDIEPSVEEPWQDLCHSAGPWPWHCCVVVAPAAVARVSLIADVARSPAVVGGSLRGQKSAKVVCNNVIHKR